MANATHYVAAGYQLLTPYLSVSNGAQAIEFYKQAFGAVERFRMPAPDGRIGHAELLIKDFAFMVADEFPGMCDIQSPKSLGGSAVALYLYVEDVDAVAERAVAAGAKLLRPLEARFYGDRVGSVVDPFGHVWHLATHIEDVSPEEIFKRASAMQEQCG